MNVAIVIPFRDRGNDPLRPANLRCAIEHWDGCDVPVWLSDDGRVETHSSTGRRPTTAAPGS